ncbi:hypothetical protein NPIL_472911 [Nephila pilipes]|uniref:Uncharacterized protein n=1 Tax=Nephila pilipes TaxID=299642 RepID=A0A8X6QVA2_NEPPI|nr:hypothetical protein NPIL_472911 [Nephila pilipes]
MEATCANALTTRLASAYGMRKHEMTRRASELGGVDELKTPAATAATHELEKVFRLWRKGAGLGRKNRNTELVQAGAEVDCGGAELGGGQMSGKYSEQSLF